MSRPRYGLPGLAAVVIEAPVLARKQRLYVELDMISEAPFFLVVATLNVTLAGFSGLVAAFRRGDQLKTFDVFHLRGIAEVGLANALIALITIPVATASGDLGTATRVGGAVVLAYIVVQIAVFALRQRRMSIRVAAPQAVGAVAIDMTVIAFAIVSIVVQSVSAYESLMVLLLARPMWDFVGVLGDTVRPEASSKTVMTDDPDQKAAS